MKIVPYRKGFGCKKNDKDNVGIAGATNEVATLKEAVAAAECNAAAERTEREKQEAEVVAEGSPDSLHCDPDSDALAEPS